MTSSKKYQWRVSAKQAGMRLLPFLKENCPEAPSTKAVKQAIDHKCCLVNGNIENFSSFSLTQGDIVAFTLEQESIPTAATILYEDRDLLVVNKPAGVLTDLKALGQRSCFLVHRLDKETSGVLLLAKHASVKEKLEALFKEKTISKLYLAIVDGIFKTEEGVIDNHLGKKGEYAGQTIYGKVTAVKGVRAVTHFRVLGRCNKASLVACEPKTGRTHQLRVHLSGMGHPILGDRQYAKTFACAVVPQRNMLHAYQVRFNHPTSKKTMTITAPIPIDFQEVMQALHLKLT